MQREMIPQDFTILKEQYAQMRLDNRPQLIRELFTENIRIERGKIWPKWLLDEENGVGEYVKGGGDMQRIRLERFHATWMHVLNHPRFTHGRGYKVRLSMKEYWFIPRYNKMRRLSASEGDRHPVIQPAIHLFTRQLSDVIRGDRDSDEGTQQQEIQTKP